MRPGNCLTGCYLFCLIFHHKCFVSCSLFLWPHSPKSIHKWSCKFTFDPERWCRLWFAVCRANSFREDKYNVSMVWLFLYLWLMCMCVVGLYYSVYLRLLQYDVSNEEGGDRSSIITSLYAFFLFIYCCFIHNKMKHKNCCCCCLFSLERVRRVNCCNFLVDRSLLQFDILFTTITVVNGWDCVNIS